MAIPLLKEIDKIPLSYRQTVKKLYSALNTGKVSHGSPYFTKSGHMVLEGNVQLDEPALARLHTTVVRPAGKKLPDLPHQNAFLRVLKKINPKMRYIRNKTLDYNTGSTTGRRRFQKEKETLRFKMVYQTLKKDAIQHFSRVRDPASFTSAPKLRKHYFK